MNMHTVLLFARHFFVLLAIPLYSVSCKEINRTVAYTTFEKRGNACIFELPDEALSLTIENVPLDSTVYITKTNESPNVIPKDRAQYLTAVQGITLNAKQNNRVAETFLTAPSSDFTPPKTFTKYEKVVNFDKKAERTERKTKKLAEKDYCIGSQKDIYVDVNSEMSIYKKKSAHFAAQGIHCSVWIIDDYNTEQLQKSASILAKAFDSMYQTIRSFFGNESDEMFCSYNGRYFEMKHMKYVSSTGTKVNIVLYDIGMKNNGLVGYFSSKDYFPQGKDYASEMLTYSNEGKYIYIDSQWAEADANICCSTLAHDFQHMIQYNQKTIIHGQIPNDSFNEMMALLCENMMQQTPENNNLNSRLALFNTGYADCGLEYRGESHYHAMLSYAVAYTFGAWLLNTCQKGSLIHNMATNPYSDIKAITHATGKNIATLLKEFSIDCVCKSQTNAYMWNVHKTEYDTKGYKYDGPSCYPYNAHHDIRPYGIVLIKIGKAEDTTISLKFNRKEFPQKEHTYIVIE